MPDQIAVFESFHPDLPPRGSVIERTAGRVIPMDERGWVLLMRGFEPAHPEEFFWFTIGGGVDDGESTRSAACRELAEEVGIIVDEEALGEPVHQWVHEFDFAERHLVQHETTYGVAVSSTVTIDPSGLDATEQLTTETIAWVDPARFVEGTETAGPSSLVEQIEAVRRRLGKQSHHRP